MTLAQLNNETTDFDLDEDLNLKTTDFENGLNVYQDDRYNWYFNLNSTVKFDVAEELLLEYTCTCDSHWPLISSNIYGSSRLSWFLMSLNKVKPNDVFKPVLSGEKVKYLDKSYLRLITLQLQDYSNY